MAYKVIIPQDEYNFKTSEYIKNSPLEIELGYEEMVEIFSVFRHKKGGNEYYKSAMKKAKQIFDLLPVTDY